MKHDGQPWERRLAVLAAQEAAMSERQNVATQTANFQAAVKAAMPSTAMDPDEPSPFRTHAGKPLEHLRITDAGKVVAEKATKP